MGPKQSLLLVYKVEDKNQCTKGTGHSIPNKQGQKLPIPIVIYLGVKIEGGFTWKHHIDCTSKGVKGTLAELLLTNPALTYGSILWGKAAISYLVKLDRVENQA